LNRRDDRNESTHQENEAESERRVSESLGQDLIFQDEVPKSTEYDGPRDNGLAELYPRDDIDGSPCRREVGGGQNPVRRQFTEIDYDQDVDPKTTRTPWRVVARRAETTIDMAKITVKTTPVTCNHPPTVNAV
jgi:hypothetical protein